MESQDKKIRHGAKHASGRAHTALIGLAVAVALLLGGQGRSLGGETISARYLQTEGTHIVLALKIPAPGPPTLILTQHLPPGVEVVSAKPPFQKFNPGAGEVKWLLQDIQPGTLTVEMETSRPLTPGDAQGTVRYRDVATGLVRSIEVAR